MERKVLSPKLKTLEKPRLKKCKFLMPCKVYREGKMVQTTRCTAYVPTFQVDEEREICGICTVPEVMARSVRCRYLEALDILVLKKTRFRCSKTNRKYIDPDLCVPNLCQNFESVPEKKEGPLEAEPALAAVAVEAPVDVPVEPPASAPAEAPVVAPAGVEKPTIPQVPAGGAKRKKKRERLPRKKAKSGYYA